MKLTMNDDGQLDVVLDEGIVTETTFETALLTSILLNRRADPEDILPYGYRGDGSTITADRQG